MAAKYADHRAQLKAILRGWDMPEDNAETTAEVLAWSDLHGIDSHGISMIPRYDELRRKGRVRMDARPRIVGQTPVSAVLYGGGGLGHVPAHFAMSTVIDKAKIVGMAAAVVRGSAAFVALADHEPRNRDHEDPRGCVHRRIPNSEFGQDNAHHRLAFAAEHESPLARRPRPRLSFEALAHLVPHRGLGIERAAPTPHHRRRHRHDRGRAP